MAQITLKLTKDEAIVVRFLLGGAHGNPSVSPPARIAAQEVLTKVDAAIAEAAAPEPEPAQAAQQDPQI
jgi:hypothetical protein